MAKIQQLREEVPIQSQPLQNEKKVDQENESLVAQPKANFMEGFTKKQSTSQPQTPRDSSFMLTLLNKFKYSEKVTGDTEKPKSKAMIRPQKNERNRSGGAYQKPDQQSIGSIERNFAKNSFQFNHNLPATSSQQHTIDPQIVQPKIKTKTITCAQKSKRATNRLFVEATPEVAQYASLSKPQGSAQPIKHINSGQQQAPLKKQPCKQRKQYYHTERNSQEQYTSRVEQKSQSRGSNYVYNDQTIVAKLKALGLQVDKSDQQCKERLQFIKPKQRRESSPATSRKQKEKVVGKQQPASKSMASAGLNKLFQNFIAQTSQQASLLQKDQIVFLLNQLQTGAAQGKITIENLQNKLIQQRVKSNSVSLRQRQPAEKQYQKCESGSTGHSFPEPANSDSAGLPRPRQMNPTRHETQEDQPLPKPRKRVQFRNVATEPELELELDSSEQASDSREDTMVEHSVVVYEEVEAPMAVSDYMQALESAKFDQVVQNSNSQNQSGEFNLMSEPDEKNGLNGILNGSQGALRGNNSRINTDEDIFVEKILLQIRDRIRSGLPLSHQLANERKLENEIESSGSRNDLLGGMIVRENNYSPDERSENVMSSGVNNFRLNRLPIGTYGANNGTESSDVNLVLSSKPSHKNNNLSRKPILELHPKKAASLMAPHPTSHKVSPTSILKQSNKFGQHEQSIESGQSELEEVRRGFRGPQVSAAKRRDYRIHQSVTHSPISHCITRDNANIFEKKKQRMAKIQQLRGISNQSEADKQYAMSSSAINLNSNLTTIEKIKPAKIEAKARLSQEHLRISKVSNQLAAANKIIDTSSGSKIPCSSGGMSLRFEKAKKPKGKTTKKHPASQPLTPRKFTIDNILSKLSTAAGGASKLIAPAITQLNEIREQKPMQQAATMAYKKGFKAPPVTSQNSHAFNSQQKKKAKGKIQQFIRRDSTSGSRRKDITGINNANALIQPTIVNMLLNPNCSATSLEERAPPMVRGQVPAVLLQKRKAEVNLSKMKQHQSKDQPAAATTSILMREVVKARSLEKQSTRGEHYTLQLDLTQKNGPVEKQQQQEKQRQATKRQNTLYSNSSAQELFKAVQAPPVDTTSTSTGTGNKQGPVGKEWLSQHMFHPKQRSNAMSGQFVPAIQKKPVAMKRSNRKQQNQTCDGNFNDMNAVLVSNFMATKVTKQGSGQQNKTPKGVAISRNTKHQPLQQLHQHQQPIQQSFASAVDNKNAQYAAMLSGLQQKNEPSNQVAPKKTNKARRQSQAFNRA